MKREFMRPLCRVFQSLCSSGHFCYPACYNSRYTLATLSLLQLRSPCHYTLPDLSFLQLLLPFLPLTNTTPFFDPSLPTPAPFTASSVPCLAFLAPSALLPPPSPLPALLPTTPLLPSPCYNSPLLATTLFLATTPPSLPLHPCYPLLATTPYSLQLHLPCYLRSGDHYLPSLRPRSPCHHTLPCSYSLLIDPA